MYILLKQFCAPQYFPFKLGRNGEKEWACEVIVAGLPDTVALPFQCVLANNKPCRHRTSVVLSVLTALLSGTGQGNEQCFYSRVAAVTRCSLVSRRTEELHGLIFPCTE